MKDVPSVEQYRQALTALAPGLPVRHREMLIRHCLSPGREVTARGLAEMVGYKTGGAVNLQYGLLGNRLGTAMGWTRPAEAQGPYAIASLSAPTGSQDEWILTMYDNLGQALEDLGWVSQMAAHLAAKQHDDDSLAAIFELQIRQRPPRQRVEAFGRAVCRLIGEAMRTSRMPGLDEDVQALLEAQEPADLPACGYLLGHLDPSVGITEKSFQELVDSAITS